MTIDHNVQQVLRQINEAALSVGRDPSGVRLVAVTKSVDVQQMHELLVAGQHRLAENRPQILRDKIKHFDKGQVEWHYIGRLQKNKVKYVYPIASLVHSVDSVDLLEEFCKWSQKTGRRCPCLLEVHISGESSKNGFSPDEILSVIESYRNNVGLDIQGMMGMGPFVDDDEVVRSSFRLLADLFRESRHLEGAAYVASELSMGMTDDFAIAIQEGATLVRIGRALFRKEDSP